jgi:hypothetical protein
VENQKQVSHRSLRPWKSLRDSHTPATGVVGSRKSKKYEKQTLKCPRFRSSVSHSRGAVQWVPQVTASPQACVTWVYDRRGEAASLSLNYRVATIR